MSDKIDLAQVFCRHGDQYCQKQRLSPQQLKVLNMIKICRTSFLGGHLQQCDCCGYQRPAYNSCRNRHCPKCQSLAKAFKRRYIEQPIGLYKAEKRQFAGHTAPLAEPDAFGRLVHSLRKKDWIVYAKRPFAGPEQVLDYLGRYTHRVAISNNRIVAMQNASVSFTYRDRADDNNKKLMTLEATEFIRRFLLHVLPDGFVKIRYFGFLAHRNKKRCIALIRKLIDPQAQPIQKLVETAVEMIQRLTGTDITCCPQCKKGKMVRTMPLAKIAATLG